MQVYRDYNLSGGKCGLHGCDRWARFRYIESERRPSWDEFNNAPAYCTQPHWRKANRKDYRPGFPYPGRGELHPRAKLRDHQVADIKARIRKGESNSAIARAYGVTRQTIGYIKKGTIWKHITLTQEHAA